MPECAFEDRPDVKWRKHYAKGADWSRKLKTARLFLEWCPTERSVKTKTVLTHGFSQARRKAHFAFSQSAFSRVATECKGDARNWSSFLARTIQRHSEAALFLESLTKAAVESPTLEQQFYEQSEKWARETEHLSSPTQMMMHPSYQAILGMAREDQEKIIHLMLRDLRDNRRLWFWGLSYLTKENPIKPADAGKLDKMIKAWVNWGTERGKL
jgi:hypothetical protein